MTQKFVITITLSEDPSDRTTPDLNFKTDASEVSSGHFAVMAKTLKQLVLAPLETHLQVASALAESAQRASDFGAFDEE
nr:MAG TPA: hypothetical protein [Caudoviricetes sp.]